ncbi:hypothetical protein F4X90_20235 [Candidatus Poribacteria bacterium]|nr:hypothetical protein [Candidatus Poribacteria bacterium]
MPNYVDVTRLDVRANRRPEVYAPANITAYEGQSISINVSVVVGYPIMNDFAHQLQNSARQSVTEGGNNPDISYSERDWSTWPANSGGLQPVTVVMPTLSGDSPTYTDWYIVWTVTSSYGTATATTRVRVYQSVAATISLPENVSAYENTSFSIDNMMYNAGSPVATEIRHSFHNSLADARADRNPVTSNRPSVVITPNASGLAALLNQPIRERTGSLRYSTNLPSVSADTTWYGRVEIVQNNAVVDSAVYTLTIRNAVAPSIRISSGEAIEGHRLSTPVTYNAGAPYANQFNHVGFYNSQSDAQNNRNRLTNSDGIPSNLVWSPLSPAARTGSQTGVLQMDLPYVSADKRIWGLARISRDNGDGSVDHWQTTYYIDILNRVPAQIDVQEVITMNENATMIIMFTYTRGVPAARGFGVSIHESQSDADNNRNPVMASDDPRITLSAYDNTGDQTAQKTGTATIVAPEVPDTPLVHSWYPRFYMDQDIITPDP